MCVADLLVPLFRSVSADLSVARRMAISAMAAYNPTSRADYVNIARTLAFSMSALALLGTAATHALTPAEKLRSLGRANALNRSADESERVMLQRRRQAQSHAQPHAPSGTLRQTEDRLHPDAASTTTSDDGAAFDSAAFDDSKMQADIAAAMKEYLAARLLAATPAQPQDAATPAAASRQPESRPAATAPAAPRPPMTPRAGTALAENLLAGTAPRTAPLASTSANMSARAATLPTRTVSSSVASLRNALLSDVAWPPAEAAGRLPPVTSAVWQTSAAAAVPPAARPGSV